MLKLYLLLLLLISTQAFSFENRFQDFQVKSAVISSAITGDIANPETIPATNFKKDLGFSRDYVSQFSLSANNTYAYLPNFSFGFLSYLSNADANLTHSATIAGSTFVAGSRLQSKIRYNAIHLHLYHSMFLDGTQNSAVRKNLDSGEVEFKIGINVKYVLYEYKLLNPNQDDTWIDVKHFIPVPYIGFTYYAYKLNLSANISTLSFLRAKSVSSDIAIAYKITPALLLSAGYIYESFHVTEKRDTVTFKLNGPKIGFSYNF